MSTWRTEGAYINAGSTHTHTTQYSKRILAFQYLLLFPNTATGQDLSIDTARCLHQSSFFLITTTGQDLSIDTARCLRFFSNIRMSHPRRQNVVRSFRRTASALLCCMFSFFWLSIQDEQTREAGETQIRLGGMHWILTNFRKKVEVGSPKVWSGHCAILYPWNRLELAVEPNQNLHHFAVHCLRAHIVGARLPQCPYGRLCLAVMMHAVVWQAQLSWGHFGMAMGAAQRPLSTTWLASCNARWLSFLDLERCDLRCKLGGQTPWPHPDELPHPIGPGWLPKSTPQWSKGIALSRLLICCYLQPGLCSFREGMLHLFVSGIFSIFVKNTPCGTIVLQPSIFRCYCWWKKSCTNW